MTETWKPIPGWEGIYEVSDHGGVRSLDRTTLRSDGQTRRYKGKAMTPTPHPRGHLIVTLQHGRRKTKRYVHQLVAEAFIGPIPEGMVVRHLDDNPIHNHVANLQIGTQAQNMADAVTNMRNKQALKTHCPYGHRLTTPNLSPSKLRQGWRGCLACARARTYIHSQGLSKSEHKRISDQNYAAIMYTPAIERRTA